MEATDKETSRDCVANGAEPAATAFTDDAAPYERTPFDQNGVQHSVRAYVNNVAHTNGIRSFRSTLKRAHEGTFHAISAKHLHRYVPEFAGEHNVRRSGMLAHMRDTVARLIGCNLLWCDPIADNGLSAVARWQKPVPEQGASERGRSRSREIALGVKHRPHADPPSFP